MARFDLFTNPNPAAKHALYLDVQSDFVSSNEQPIAESCIEFMLRGY